MMFAKIRVGVLLLLFLPGASLADTGEAGIRFGVLSIAAPARTHAEWQPFIRYLSGKLGEPVNLIVPRGFERMRQAVSDGKVDIFYGNSHVFYRLKQAGKAVGIAQMQNIEGDTMGRSEIFVRGDSDIHEVDQLRRKRIAYVSPVGAGGYLAARAYFYGHGLETGEVSEEIFTENLSNSIHQVLLGDSDAGSMCGVNYRLMSEKLNTGELRIIGVSDIYPENVIGAHTDVPAALRLRIEAIILGMVDDTEGRAVLAGMRDMKIQRFVEYDPAAEAVTRSLLEQAQLKH